MIGAVSHWLVPPEGPIFFENTQMAFPFQWMIDGGHIVTFAAFIVIEADVAITKRQTDVDFFANLARTARFYALATVGGALSVFVGVEGWRAVAWLLSLDGPSILGVNGLAVVTVSLSLAVALAYLWDAYRTEKHHRLMSIIVAGCYPLFGAVALYGLYASAARLLCGSAGYGPLAATSLSMAAFLCAYLVFHRRTGR